jgi:hypothetical protein
MFPTATVTQILLLGAFVCTLLAAVGRAPLWAAVFLLTVAGLLGAWPAR